ncbi:MAG: type II CRISPR-associated endonuclease Cas1 [Ahrensia sp.]|nr:type II CRISPR-associated endonuclease Cas1 [Ahrensia sp.]
MERIVDISTDGLHLAVARGFLTVSEGREERGRIALDDIGAVIAHAHGLTWSNNLFVQLSKRDVPVVLCATNHAPVTCLWPLEGHHRQSVRMRAQAMAPKPVKKQIWRRIVSSKIAMQAAVLRSAGEQGDGLDAIARRVRSGDPDNLEAQAARRYWPALMGAAFRRDRDGNGPNALLNYGYTVLRAIVSRAICAAGLHPTFGIHHANQNNAFPLADDLMEPYRPLVDRMVLTLIETGIEDVTSEAKAALAGLSALDIDTPTGGSPLSIHVGRVVHAVAECLVDRSVPTSAESLNLPLPLSPLAMAGFHQLLDRNNG